MKDGEVITIGVKPIQIETSPSAHVMPWRSLMEAVKEADGKLRQDIRFLLPMCVRGCVRSKQ